MSLLLDRRLPDECGNPPPAKLHPRFLFRNHTALRWQALTSGKGKVTYELGTRVRVLAKFGLEVDPDKTRLIAFERETWRNRKRAGQGKLEFLRFSGAKCRRAAGRTTPTGRAKEEKGPDSRERGNSALAPARLPARLPGSDPFCPTRFPRFPVLPHEGPGRARGRPVSLNCAIFWRECRND
jgi:hypothetical protein